MGFLSNLIGKKGREARASMAKLENKDLLEAVVAGSILVAAGDGELEDSEINKLERIIKTNDKFAHFGSEITQMIGKFSAQFKEGGIRIVRQAAMKELNDIKHNPDDVATVMNSIITVAEADGEIEEGEVAVLNKIAETLGVRVADYM